MRKLILFFTLCTFIFAHSEIFGQKNGFSLHVGVTSPMGSFSKTENAFAGSGNSGAKNGLAIGAKLQYGIPLPILGNLKFMATADLMYNGMKDEVFNSLNNYENIPLGFGASAPNIYNIPLMAGVNFSLINVIVFKLYLEGAAGVNFRMISDMEQLVPSPVLEGMPIATKVQFDNTKSFAFQLGVGMCLLRRVSLTFNYYNLGNAELTGTRTLTSESAELVENVPAGYENFTNGKTRTSMFVLRLGFHF